MYITVGEARLYSFLEDFNHVDACGETKHSNRGFAGLSNVKEIVKERLTWMGGEEVEFIEDEDDGPGGGEGRVIGKTIGGSSVGRGSLGWVGKKGKQGGEGVGVVACLMDM
jgi:hypothetical protein